MEKHFGKDSPKENILKDPRVKKFFPQIEKEICSY